MLKNIEAKHKYNLESELYEVLFVPKLILQKCIGYMSTIIYKFAAIIRISMKTSTRE